MNNVLSVMQDIKKNKKAQYLKKNLKKHPIVKESIEIKIHYLNGLALMMNVDDEIAETERDFFVTLIEVFELGDSVIDDFIAFAKEPQKEQVVELLEELAKSDLIKFCFMIDNFKMANKDGKYGNEEKELIKLFFGMLNFTDDEIEFLSKIGTEISDVFEYSEKFSEFNRAIKTFEEKADDDPKPDAPEGFVFVKGGTFSMGDHYNEEDSDALPLHDVTLDDFYVGKYEVTQKEWKDIMGSNPSDFKGDTLPVENVSWYDAVEFCNKKSEKEGLAPCYTGSGRNIKCNFSANGYRLPTEAEWEYAARGGNKSKGYKYAGSNNIGDVAWYSSNSGGKTHPVGQKKPNELGIYDMSGNVYEWCWDLSGSYPSGAQTNPAGPSSGSDRVVRGGSWYSSNASHCTVSYRYNAYPDYSSFFIGFRLLRVSP